MKILKTIDPNDKNDWIKYDMKQVMILYPQYYLFASDNLKKAEKILKESGKPDDDFHITREMEAFNIHVIIFSALCMEAFINHYGLDRLGSSLFNEVDRLPIVSKFKIIPSLFLKNEFILKGHINELIVNLFKKRDSLVHHKTKIIKFLDRKYSDHVTITDSRLGFKSIKLVIDELKNFDPSYDYKPIDNIIRSCEIST